MTDVERVIYAAFELAGQYFYRVFPNSFSVYNITKETRVKLQVVSPDTKAFWFTFTPIKGKTEHACRISFDSIQEELDKDEK